MYSTISLNKKIEQLRGLEDHGYSIAHYLLMDDELAAEALKVALLEISNDISFFDLSLKAQQTILQRIVTREVFRLTNRQMMG
ncbi:hypothetical protein [Paenibacillus endoradicis]|uniref:hypothetical protein n=1 Tax=Paenibacillus endoradicis TaxID=2972487 RepID=UPI0021595D2E|nr:hypothetical protein [Paenibacillus endoradicis]MCR8659528.1 hypothetical protein [Paenibacillus endoradicis]